MSTRRVVLGNWKMNTTLAEAGEIAAHLAAERFPEDVVVGVAPPFPWLSAVKASLSNSGICLGAQTCAATGRGAYTGEVSAAMLAELCSFVLLGHSERRAMFGESDDIVKAKLERVLESGLRPVVCVGESLEHRQAGSAGAIVVGQIHAALSGVDPRRLVDLTVAYEPVWAIGTGLTASPEDAEMMGANIAIALVELGIGRIPILYGGSVTAANAALLISAGNVDGFLVGGTSLKPLDFSAIVNAAQN